MTVAELIAALQALPPDAQVFSDADGDSVGVVEMEGPDVALRGYPREPADPWTAPTGYRLLEPGESVASALATVKPGEGLLLPIGHHET